MQKDSIDTGKGATVSMHRAGGEEGVGDSRTSIHLAISQMSTGQGVWGAGF